MRPAVRLLLLAVCGLFAACSYQNEEELFGPADAACDTSGVTYAGTIAPLLQQNCYSCHSGPTPEAGIDLSSYSIAKLYANNGTLLNVVTHAPGYPAMPKNQAKLPACDINRLRAWIEAGAPNN